MEKCDIFIDGEIVGSLFQDGKEIRFAYASSWVDSGHLPISASLSLDGTFNAKTARNFFTNLLPEGARMDRFFSLAHIRSSDLISFLSIFGGDLPGNISVGQKEKQSTLKDVTSRVEKLVSDGHSLDTLQEGISLAGVEPKTAVILSTDGNGKYRFLSPTEKNPSTHILKQSPGICIIEAMTMAIVATSGIATAKTRLVPVAGKPILLVRRYDREFLDGKFVKIAQEDFCQALGRPAGEKYWQEDGTSIGNKEMLSVLELLPYAERIRFSELVCASLVVGNNDDHAKNYSILHLKDGDRLAPAYDVTSAVAAKKLVESCKYISTRLARPFGAHIEPSEIIPEDVLLHAYEYYLFEEDCIEIWNRVPEAIKKNVRPAIDAVVADAESQDFDPKQVRLVKDFALVTARMLENRAKRFVKFASKLAPTSTPAIFGPK